MGAPELNHNTNGTKDMGTDERLAKLLKASPTTLEKIDAILDGRAHTDVAEIDLRTITLKDAATRLGVSRPTVYRLIRNRALETVLIGGYERVPLRSLIAYATRSARKANA